METSGDRLKIVVPSSRQDMATLPAQSRPTLDEYDLNTSAADLGIMTGLLGPVPGAGPFDDFKLDITRPDLQEGELDRDAAKLESFESAVALESMFNPSESDIEFDVHQSFPGFFGDEKVFHVHGIRASLRKIEEVIAAKGRVMERSYLFDVAMHLSLEYHAFPCIDENCLGKHDQAFRSRNVGMVKSPQPSASQHQNGDNGRSAQSVGAVPQSARTLPSLLQAQTPQAPPRPTIRLTVPSLPSQLPTSRVSAPIVGRPRAPKVGQAWAPANTAAYPTAPILVAPGPAIGSVLTQAAAPPAPRLRHPLAGQPKPANIPNPTPKPRGAGSYAAWDNAHLFSGLSNDQILTGWVHPKDIQGTLAIQVGTSCHNHVIAECIEALYRRRREKPLGSTAITKRWTLALTARCKRDGNDFAVEKARIIAARKNGRSTATDLLLAIGPPLAPLPTPSAVASQKRSTVGGFGSANLINARSSDDSEEAADDDIEDDEEDNTSTSASQHLKQRSSDDLPQTESQTSQLMRVWCDCTHAFGQPHHVDCASRGAGLPVPSDSNGEVTAPHERSSKRKRDPAGEQAEEEPNQALEDEPEKSKSSGILNHDRNDSGIFLGNQGNSGVASDIPQAKKAEARDENRTAKRRKKDAKKASGWVV